jgi:putative ABC transport system permease protein
VLLAIALSTLVFVWFTNRIMFKVGVRNIPRRRAQTTLIVLGLMLSTVIISAAFTTGDTIDRSVTNQVYTLLGSVDEMVVSGNADETDLDNDSASFTRDVSFAESDVAPVVSRLQGNSDVDAIIPMYTDVAVAVNESKQLSSPLFNLSGIDPQATADLDDIKNVSGGTVHVSDLARNEIFVNESAAEDLDASPGDTIRILTADNQATFTVKAIVKDGRLAGSAGISTRREGGVVALETARSFFNAPGRLTALAVSNRGDSRGGLDYVTAVEAEMDAALESSGVQGLNVQPVKESGVNVAETFSSVFATVFLALGLFSIAAGVLLIFMIFVMLAAERKPEMGMARAIGTKRMDIVQTFMAEGMGYNVLAAAVGAAIGVLVSFIIANIISSLFSESNLEIAPYVTPRSLIVSYSLGVVLTFLTVTFSSWRVSMINIVQAIRDLPEGVTQKPMWGSRGILRTLLYLFFRPTTKAGWWRRLASTIALVLAGVAGGVPILFVPAFLILLGVFISYAVSQQGMPWMFRTGIVIGTVLVMPFSIAAAFFMTFQLGPVLILAGVPLVAIGASEMNAFALLFGLSVLPLGIALLIRSFGANERLTYTLTGLFLIYIWEIDFSVGALEAIFGEMTGGPELFFLSGAMVTIAATFIIVYNADLILAPLTYFGKGLGALLPSIKMAVAYPLANKMHTGMTMAMFCLVVFALVMISSFNHNFNLLFRSEAALGGWDIVVDENPSSPIIDLRSKLAAANADVLNDIESVGTTSIMNQRNAQLCQPRSNQTCDPSDPEESGFEDYEIRGEDNEFIDSSNIRLQARAVGYSDDRAVWEAVRNNDSLAVVDSNAIVGGFGASQIIRNIGETDTEFAPVELRMRDARTGEVTNVTVIGLIDQGSSGTFLGLHVSQDAFESFFGEEPDSRRYFVADRAGADHEEVARGIEAALLTTGAQAESLRELIDEQGAVINGFFYLMQGFMGLGLFVGVAAVGVIAFRTVVERRQQIGMLRAIGYTRKMIGLTFLIESAFIAFLGVLSGVVFSLILARQLITDSFANQGSSFSIPWIQVLIISGLAFGFALLMTLIPSRQAAKIPIADALRYE